MNQRMFKKFKVLANTVYQFLLTELELFKLKYKIS